MSQKTNNRLIYDTCASQQKTDQSTKPLAYDFFKGKFVNCSKCKDDNNLPNNQDLSDRIDIETDLTNRTTIHSKCNETKHLPKCQDGTCDTTHATPPTLCDRSIIWKKFQPPQRPSNAGIKSPEEYLADVNAQVCPK